MHFLIMNHISQFYRRLCTWNKVIKKAARKCIFFSSLKNFPSTLGGGTVQLMQNKLFTYKFRKRYKDVLKRRVVDGWNFARLKSPWLNSINLFYNLSFPIIGKGCASVLNTQLSKGISESSENKRYKYFKVSAMKKLCWTSSCWTGMVSTSRIPEKPSPTSQYFLIAWNNKRVPLFVHN